MANEDRVFRVDCECCGAKIHIDPVRREVFYTEHPDKPQRSFEEVVRDVKGSPQRAAEKFQAGLEAEENKEERLDALFRKAKKKAEEEDTDEPPPSIWDFR